MSMKQNWHSYVGISPSVRQTPRTLDGHRGKIGSLGIGSQPRMLLREITTVVEIVETQGRGLRARSNNHARFLSAPANDRPY
jgi:hypothetical protein